MGGSTWRSASLGDDAKRRVRLRLTEVAALVVLCGGRLAFGDSTAIPPHILASADLAIDKGDLGRPFDARFEALPGRAGKSLFAGAQIKKLDKHGLYRFERVEVDDSLHLAANARAWGLGSASAGARSGTRYMAYRAIQLEYVLELEETQDPAPAPAGTAFYLSKIYYGRMFEWIVAGAYDDFDAKLRADLLAYEGGISFVERQRGLRVTKHLSGLEPTKEALLDGDNVQQHYMTSKDKAFSSPVPILVEFTRAPKGDEPTFESYDWKQHRWDERVRRASVEVDSKNSGWTDSGLKVEAGDLVVVVEATPKRDGKDADIKLGSLGHGSSSPRGASNRDGELQMRIGDSGRAVGYRDVEKAFVARDAGPLLFHLRDGAYGDNSGYFDIDVVVVSGGIVSPCRPAPGNSEAFKRRSRCTP